jgi:hypothetical protein
MTEAEISSELDAIFGDPAMLEGPNIPRFSKLLMDLKIFGEEYEREIVRSLQESSPHSLVEKLNPLLADGWRLHGSVMQRGNDFMQMIVKLER